MTATPEHAFVAIKSVTYPNNVKQVEHNVENVKRKATLKKIAEQSSSWTTIE
jgi:hypothetical protein